MELQKNGEYKEKRSSSGMVKIYYKRDPVSSRRTLANTYNDIDKTSGDITFDQFVRDHKNWMKNS